MRLLGHAAAVAAAAAAGVDHDDYHNWAEEIFDPHGTESKDSDQMLSP